MNTVKLQIPMDKEVRDKLELRANALGFDSAQAYIRFWAKAETDGRRVSFNEPEVMTPAMEIIIEQAEKEIAAGEVSKAYTNVDDFLADLKG